MDDATRAEALKDFRKWVDEYGVIYESHDAESKHVSLGTDDGIEALGKLLTSLKTRINGTELPRKQPMSHDLSKHADTLGDVSRFFVSEAPGRLPCVVRHATGEPEYVLTPDGGIKPYDPTNSLSAIGASVVNPPGFVGFPDHDKGAVEYQLATHGLDPATHFVHFEADKPLVVRHATGEPEYVIDGAELKPLGV